MNEPIFKVPENFVKEFFIEILRIKKNEKRKSLKEKKERKIKTKMISPSLEEEAQKIRILEEKSQEIPLPIISKTKKTIKEIVVPKQKEPMIQVPIPRFHQINFIDLGKLNTFIQDPNVTLIQCDGPGFPIKIHRINKLVTTNIYLNEKEIKKIIHKFSIRTNKPLTEPIFRTEFKDLAITAIISPISLRFVIVRKRNYKNFS